MNGLWLLGGIGLVAMIAVFVAVKWGKAKARADYFEESHDKAAAAREIDESVARMSDARLDKELRDGS